MRKTWVYNPHTGGKTIPPDVRERTKRRILAYAKKHYAGKYTRIDVRFRVQLCYIDAYTKPYIPPDFSLRKYGETRKQRIERMSNTPTHLCRIRHFGDENRWSLAFFTYSHEKYKPCTFRNGTFHGTPEEAFEVGAVYLQD